MVIRSTALINALARGFGIRELLRDGYINVYSGTQPVSADVAPTGTHLLTYTKDGLTYVPATRAFADITIGGTVGGSIDTVTVGGMSFNLLSSSVPFRLSAAATAIDIAANINARQNPLNIIADTNSEHLYLRAPHWLGAEANNLSFMTTVTAPLTATDSGVFGSGVNAQNGLNFLESIVDGKLNKESEIWQAIGLVSILANSIYTISSGSITEPKS